MTSMNRSKTGQTKLKLGKKTDSGYEYSTKIDFKEDFAKQIAKLMAEKKAHDKLKSKLKNLEKTVSVLASQEKNKNLLYYYKIGKSLLFVERGNFKNVSSYSVYRRITEEIPQILPHIKDLKITQKHLEIMYRLAHIKEDLLKRASWDQWYEMMKFKNLHKNQKALGEILNLIKGKKISGPKLRLLISKKLRRN